MTRDELEAVIWRHWPTRGREAVAAVDAILAACDGYRRDCPKPDPWAGQHRAELLVALDGYDRRCAGLDADGNPPYGWRREYLDGATA
jgi:hypothetical protein